MEFRIAEAQKRVGDIFPFAGSLDADGETWLGRELKFNCPMQVEGTYVFDSGIVTVEGRLKASLADVCSLCGKSITIDLDLPFSERFERVSQWDEEHETYAYEGETILLDRMLLDILYLNLPIAPVCKTDCKGLCPVCGADRNIVDCGCERAEKDNPFAVLKQMTNINKEV